MGRNHVALEGGWGAVQKTIVPGLRAIRKFVDLL
jgi:hypothetical protein